LVEIEPIGGARTYWRRYDQFGGGITNRLVEIEPIGFFTATQFAAKRLSLRPCLPLRALARSLRMTTLELRFSGDLELEALIRTRDKRMVRHKVPYLMSEGRNASVRMVRGREPR
jgi:hypothetical protein